MHQRGPRGERGEEKSLKRARESGRGECSWRRGTGPAHIQVLCNGGHSRDRHAAALKHVTGLEVNDRVPANCDGGETTTRLSQDEQVCTGHCRAGECQLLQR